MPCLNEEETLERCITKAQASLQKENISGEILVADNGSTDSSVEIALRLGARVIRVAEKGYGNALRAGIAAARGQWVLLADADDSYDFSSIQPFLEKLSAGYDFVMGCRLESGGGTIMPGAMPWKHRWIGVPALSMIGRVFYKCPVHDFHCGMRAFRRDAILGLGLRTSGMEFASEMVIQATLAGLKIANVPITLYRDGRSRPPHLRSWRDGWRHLRFMLLYSPTWLFLFPGLFSILAGSLVSLRLWLGPWKIGPYGFDTNTMLVATMCVSLGIETTLFGIFTKIYAMSAGMLPVSKRWLLAFRLVTLERGILAGLIVGLCGLGILIKSLVFWKAAHFGPLDYPTSLRMVIPAIFLMITGAQLFFSSFLFSILGGNFARPNSPVFHEL